MIVDSHNPNVDRIASIVSIQIVSNSEYVLVTVIDKDGLRRRFQASESIIKFMHALKPELFSGNAAPTPLTTQDSDQSARNADLPKPPTASETVAAMFILRSVRDAYIGDRREVFQKDAAALGARRAAWLYRWDTTCDVARSLLRLASPSNLMSLGSAMLRYFT